VQQFAFPWADALSVYPVPVYRQHVSVREAVRSANLQIWCAALTQAERGLQQACDVERGRAGMHQCSVHAGGLLEVIQKPQTAANV
jgi:hypothetical protein